jgi:hypothetical protein
MTSTDAIMKSIQERRDGYHIALAALLGAEFVIHKLDHSLVWYRYQWLSRAVAARYWLQDHDHDLNGWQEKRDDTP